jgi:hypothetical protein
MPAPVSVSIANNAITVTPGTVYAGNSPNVHIMWKIENSPGWSFTSNGIVIKNNDGQFDSPEPAGPNFKWHDKNSNNKNYPYTVNVTDGTTTLTLDPAIQNQGGNL